MPKPSALFDTIHRGIEAQFKRSPMQCEALLGGTAPTSPDQHYLNLASLMDAANNSATEFPYLALYATNSHMINSFRHFSFFSYVTRPSRLHFRQDSGTSDGVFLGVYCTIQKSDFMPPSYKAEKREAVDVRKTIILELTLN